MDAVKASQDKSFDLIIYLGQNIQSGVLMYKSKVPLVHYPINDGVNPVSKIEFLMDFLAERAIVNEDKVLLACRYGISRSSGISILCLASLVTDEFGKLSFDDAYSVVKDKINQFEPKPELINQLRQILSDGIWEEK